MFDTPPFTSALRQKELCWRVGLGVWEEQRWNFKEPEKPKSANVSAPSDTHSVLHLLLLGCLLS